MKLSYEQARHDWYRALDAERVYIDAKNTGGSTREELDKIVADIMRPSGWTAQEMVEESQRRCNLKMRQRGML